MTENTNNALGQEQLRIKCLLEAPRVVTFFEENDLELPGLLWTVYGVFDSNEIVVKATAGSAVYYAITPSPLTYPAMERRLSGIDYADEAVARELANAIWRIHQQVFRAELGVAL